jgi:hypothetical protein
LSRIYFTHCTYKKDNSLRASGEQVRPDRLYVGKKIQGFIQKCRSAGVEWAIFSNEYGIWFWNERHAWYDTSPNDLENNAEKKRHLFDDASRKLEQYDIVYFYANYKSRRFHRVYRQLSEDLLKSGVNIHLFSHKSEIG